MTTASTVKDLSSPARVYPKVWCYFLSLMYALLCSQGFFHILSCASFFHLVFLLQGLMQGKEHLLDVVSAQFMCCHCSHWFEYSLHCILLVAHCILYRFLYYWMLCVVSHVSTLTTQHIFQIAAAALIVTFMLNDGNMQAHNFYQVHRVGSG